MVDFQQQSPQRLVDEYEHMNGRNHRLDLRLNSPQRENYFIKYEKSYVIHCKYAYFHSHRHFSLHKKKWYEGVALCLKFLGFMGRIRVDEIHHNSQPI